MSTKRVVCLHCTSALDERNARRVRTSFARVMAMDLRYNIDVPLRQPQVLTNMPGTLTWQTGHRTVSVVQFEGEQASAW